MESRLGLFIPLSATQWLAYLLIAVCASLWLITRHAFRVNIAPGEPIPLSSRVPIFGHLLGMLASGSGYYMSLFRKTGRELQAATLSIFGHKVYVIFSPSLAQAALRNRDLSFEPFVVLASHALANLEGRSLELLRDGTISRAFFHTLPTAVAAEPMSRMAATGLLSMTGEIEHLCHRIDVSVDGQAEFLDLFGYLKKTMTLAVTDALYGLEDNVFREDLTLIDDLWYIYSQSSGHKDVNTKPVDTNHFWTGHLTKPYLILLQGSCPGYSHQTETGLGSASKPRWQNTTVNIRSTKTLPSKQRTLLCSGTEYSAAWGSTTQR